MDITSEQIMAARGLIRWSRADLAERSGISIPTIKRIEQSKGSAQGRNRTVDAIRQTLEDAGIEFIETCGVRLREKGQEKG